MDRNTGRSILIVGAGCFGISTAYHLLKRGYKDITVLDRSRVLPAPDAASTDMSASLYHFCVNGISANAIF